MLPSLSCLVDQPANITLATDEKQFCQGSTASVGQADNHHHPAATAGHQSQEQLQQHQEQQHEVTGEPVSDL